MCSFLQFPTQIYSNIHSWFIYTDEFIRIFFCPMFMIANIFEFSLFPKIGLKWLLMVQNGLMWAKNNTNYNNGQNSSKQSWTNNQIFEHIRIFWTNIFIYKSNRWFLLDQINLDIYSWSFYHAVYIRIFIHEVYMVMNIFG